MKRYEKYLKEQQEKSIYNTRVDTVGAYVKAPKKILIDPLLTPKEKIAWLVLASFQFTHKGRIFPSRERLSMLLGIEGLQHVSRLTRKLQEKGYLFKEYGANNQTFYWLSIDDTVNDSAFRPYDLKHQTLRKSRFNRLQS